MSNFNIEKLINLLEKGEISKDELLSAMNQIQFQPVNSVAGSEEQKNDSQPEEQNLISSPNVAQPEKLDFKENEEKNMPLESMESPIKGIEENIQNLEKGFDPILQNSPLENDVENNTNGGNSKEEIQQSIVPVKVEPQFPNQNSIEQMSMDNAAHCETTLQNDDNVKNSPLSEKRFSKSTAVRPYTRLTKPESARDLPTGFFQRIENFKNHKESRLREKEKMIRELETKECSFHPKINESENQNNSPKTNIAEITERLNRPNKKTDKIEQIRMEIEHKEAMEIMENCTFKPFVYSKYAKPKYLEAANEIGALKSLSVTCKSCSNIDSQYTFRPETNKLPNHGMQQAKEYLSLDPYTRLSQSTTKAQKILEKYSNCEEDAIISKSQMQAGDNEKQKLQDFYNRQLSFEARKQENRQKLLLETSIKGMPEINKKSEEIAKNLVNFEERNEVLLNRNEDYIMKQGEEFHKDYTFRPEINPVSKSIKQKSYDEMCYGPVVQKEMKIEKIKQNIAQKESKACSFRPTLNEKKKFEAVQSKLQLRDNIDTYLERVQLQKMKQENQAKIIQQKKEYEEIMQCTYAPKINDLPYYMKVKQEVELRSSQNLTSGRKESRHDSYTKKHSTKL